MATNPVDLMGALNAYRQSIQGQRERLMQPAPQQGGFLSGADPVMLSLAAGLLSPTKTGGFGESVASGLSAAAGPLSDIRKQEEARLDKLGALSSAEAKLAMDMYELQNGGRGARARDPALNAKIWGDMADQLEGQSAMLNDDDPKKAELQKQANFLRRKAASIAGYAENEDDGEGSSATGSKQDTGKTTAKPYTGENPPPNYPNAKKGKFGYWYVPNDPNDPSKGYQYVAE